MSLDRKSFISRVRRESNQALTRRRHRQRGFSLIELLVVIAIILIILSIAVPQMSKMRMNAQEMAAVAEIGTINKAQTQYYSQFNQYATTLAQLGPPASGGGAEGPQAAGLIPGSLANGASGGYNFTVTQSAQGYAISAVPKSFGTSGRRTFYSDQSGITHQNWGQDPATAASPQL
jgi:type IV pilus assembly protein PilA